MKILNTNITIKQAQRLLPFTSKIKLEYSSGLYILQVERKVFSDVSLLDAFLKAFNFYAIYTYETEI